MSDLGFFLAVLASVFALVDPLGALPFYVALTEGFGTEDRLVIARRAVVVTTAILLVFALFGRFLFELFGFTLAAFQIAGGILLFVVAYDMLQGQTARTKLTEGDAQEALARRDELSVVPLGIPLLAGPGAISTVMIYEGSAGGNLAEILATFVAIVIVCAATFLILRYGQSIFRRLGSAGIKAVTRVMGLLLAAVGVQFVINGVLAFGAHP